MARATRIESGTYLYRGVAILRCEYSDGVIWSMAFDGDYDALSLGGGDEAADTLREAKSAVDFFLARSE